MLYMQKMILAVHAPRIILCITRNYSYSRTADITQWVKRWTRERNVASRHRLWIRIPPTGQLKLLIVFPKQYLVFYVSAVQDF